MRDRGYPTLMTAADPSLPSIAMLKHEAVQEAARLARVVTQALKLAAEPGQSAPP